MKELQFLNNAFFHKKSHISFKYLDFILQDEGTNFEGSYHVFPKIWKIVYILIFANFAWLI